MPQLPPPPTPQRSGHATNQEIGKRGEDIAATYLSANGFRILARNWRCPRGEIDLIARDDTHTVAVEVKTRTGTGFGSPLEAITHAKAKRLRTLLLTWAASAGRLQALLRIDAVGVLLLPDGSAPRIEHLRGIS